MVLIVGGARELHLIVATHLCLGTPPVWVVLGEPQRPPDCVKRGIAKKDDRMAKLR